MTIEERMAFLEEKVKICDDLADQMDILKEKMKSLKSMHEKASLEMMDIIRDGSNESKDPSLFEQGQDESSVDPLSMPSNPSGVEDN